MEINLYLRTLQRGWGIIVVVVLAAVNLSFLVSYLTPPVYETSSRFVVSPNADVYSNTWDIVDSLDTLDRRSIINTYKELLGSPSIYGQGLEDQSIDTSLLESEYGISVVVVPDTNILKLTVDGPDPARVVEIANAIGVEALNYINRLYPVYNFSVLDAPEFPTTPIRPEPVRNAGLAIFIGLILGVGLAFSREQMQISFDRLRERSVIDTVTSAFTRAHFERRFREMVVQNPDTQLSLGIINFRGIDEGYDVFPQSVVDRVLQKISQTLKSELRGRDIVGRWDRAKLAVLLPSAPNSAVESTFKRIQKYLEEPVRLNDTGDIVIHPDPCVGVVSRNQFETNDELVKRAESAMAQASAFSAPSVVFITTPFILNDEGDPS
jgi:diguanylate cyclase (GGDEF)-like protein